MKEEIERLYGNRLRIRVCGICVNEKEELLLINHKMGKSGTFWSPPGGGIELGETPVEALKREFLEETGLIISVEKLLFIHEFREKPLFAIELFFAVRIIGGTLLLGKDPEMPENKQLIKALKWITMNEIKQFSAHEIHHALKSFSSIKEIYETHQGTFT
jgi:8-oxo-dGTP diphosphatase